MNNLTLSSVCAIQIQIQIQIKLKKKKISQSILTYRRYPLTYSFHMAYMTRLETKQKER